MFARFRVRRAFPYVLGVLVAATAPVRAQQPVPAATDAAVDTAPVVIDGEVLFRVRGASSLPAENRASLIQERIIAVAQDPGIAPAALQVVAGETLTRIVAGTVTVMTIVEADAELEQLQPPQLAALHLDRIRRAIGGYRAARTPAAMQRAAINTLIATIAMALALLATSHVRRRLEGVLTRRWQARIHTVGIQSFELMRAEQIWRALRSALMTMQTVAILAIALVFVGFVLSQFPATRGSARSLTAFALAPLRVIGSGVIAHVPNVVFLVVLFYVIRLGLRLLRLFFDAVERGQVKLSGFDAEWSQPTYKIVRLAVVAFGLIVAYPYIPGSQSAAFKGVSLFIGVVFSLGSSAAISNIIAGYMMTYRRAFKVGDRVRIGNTVGEVVATRLQVTHLRSPKNEEIVVPNSQILAGEVLNYSSLARDNGLILHTQVGIGYETPWRQVEALLLLAAERTPGLAREPRPFVLEKSLGDFAVVYELNAYCTNVSAMLQLYAELHRHILDVFNEYGVQIMTPAYESDPIEPKVVRQHDWYAAPATGLPPRDSERPTANSQPPTPEAATVTASQREAQPAPR